MVDIGCRTEANQLTSPNAHSSVSLFEYKNKFIGGDFAIPWAHSIITGFGGLFVLCVEEGSKVKASRLFVLIRIHTYANLSRQYFFNLDRGVGREGHPINAGYFVREEKF